MFGNITLFLTFSFCVTSVLSAVTDGHHSGDGPSTLITDRLSGDGSRNYTHHHLHKHTHYHTHHHEHHHRHHHAHEHEHGKGTTEAEDYEDVLDAREAKRTSSGIGEYDDKIIGGNTDDTGAKMNEYDSEDVPKYNATMVAPVIIEATGKHTSSLIFLHGLGDTGHGWASSMAELKPPHAKVICPTADTMPVTLNGGYPMPSWFDLISLDVNSKEDEEGIKRAAHKVHGFIDQEVAAGISSDRIVIAGFSQGGALALYSALTYPKKLAGVVGLSCWLPLHKTFPGAAANNPNLHTHFLQCHGNCDPIVPYKWGLLTSTLLKSFVQNVTLNTYQGLAHSTSDEEISDMRNFVNKVMPHA